jgi:hypothetical protein
MSPACRKIVLEGRNGANNPATVLVRSDDFHPFSPQSTLQPAVSATAVGIAVSDYETFSAPDKEESARTGSATVKPGTRNEPHPPPPPDTGVVRGGAFGTL